MTFFHYPLSKIFIAVPINYFAAFPGVTSPPNFGCRASNSMEPHGNVSFHRLGGRDHGDPLSNVMVTRSDKGWHCPECIHIGKSQCGKPRIFLQLHLFCSTSNFCFLISILATTKGNLKSHILSGRHKLSEKSFKCRFCDRSYSTRQSMQVHISTNHRQERDMEMNKDLPLIPGGGAVPMGDLFPHGTPDIPIPRDTETKYNPMPSGIEDHSPPQPQRPPPLAPVQQGPPPQQGLPQGMPPQPQYYDSESEDNTPPHSTTSSVPPSGLPSGGGLGGAPPMGEMPRPPTNSHVSPMYPNSKSSIPTPSANNAYEEPMN